MLRALRAIVLGLTLAVILLSATPILAQEAAAAPGDIEVVLTYPDVVIVENRDTIDVRVKVTNVSDSPKEVQYEIEEGPESWNVGVWSQFLDFKIRRMLLEPGVENELRVRVEFADEAEIGAQTFTLRILASDGALLNTQEIAIEREALPGVSDSNGQIVLNTRFPQLKGPTSSIFEFETVIRNETSNNVALDLAAEAPQGWTVSFLPTFGEERVISNISIEATRTERLKTRVTPPRQAPPGGYQILVNLSEEEYATVEPFQVNLTGTFELSAGTIDGRLNVDADAGETTTVNLLLLNAGTADIQSLTFLREAPPGWTVEVAPEEMFLAAGQPTEDVTVTITPSTDAVPGDYAITIHAQSPEVFEAVVLRVTVAQSTIWGAVGVALIVIILGGLVGLFYRLGRR